MSNSKTDPNQPINTTNYRESYTSIGLTKREYFAALIIQGICANQNYNATQEFHFNNAAQDAVKQADALIKSLKNDQQ